MWKSDRKQVDTKWSNRKLEINTNWIHNRKEKIVDWMFDRTKHWTYSRKYMLWSFFEMILTAILDPKDWKAIRIKSDPAYPTNTEYLSRKENNSSIWKSRI